MNSSIKGTLNKIKLGETLRCYIGVSASIENRFSAKDVSGFAKLTGDLNPVHQDSFFHSMNEYQNEQKINKLRRKLYQKPIVHGLLYTSLIPTLFATQVPGTLYKSQTYDFKRPVHFDELVTAHIEVIKMIPRVGYIKCLTKCIKEDGSVACDGIAELVVPSLKLVDPPPHIKS